MRGADPHAKNSQMRTPLTDACNKGYTFVFNVNFHNEEKRQKLHKGGSRHKNLCMTRVLGFLIRYFSNCYTLHRSDLAERAAPLDPRLVHGL